MEEYQNGNNNNKNNFNNKLSFSECFYNGLDITPIITESLENMKKFISFAIAQLKKISEQKDDKSSLFLSGKVLDYINNNNEKLGIPFFYILMRENDIKTIISNLFLDNIYITKIKLLLEKIVDIFNFKFDEKEIKNYLYIFCDELLNIGVIGKSDLKEDEVRASPTDEEDLFLTIESIIEHFLTNKDDDIEKGAKEYICDLLSLSENIFAKLRIKDNLTKASIEFYEEKIKQIKNFINSVNFINGAQFNINNLGQNYIDKDEIDDNEDEDEDEEEKSPEEIVEDIKQLRKKPLKDRTYFYKEELIVEDENEYIEFKQYYFPLDEKHIMELKRQMCAFLNSNGGRLYIGINDHKIVKGVKANEKIIYYEKLILNLANNFCPKIEPNNYFKFYAIPVKSKDNGKIINNRFVFKILIKKGEETQLYYIDDNKLNISIRQNGQCANLKASEIHQKIIERKNMENKNNLIKDESFDMDDPAPLYNKKIENNEIQKDNWRAPRPIKKKKQNKPNINYNNININKKDKQIIENKIEEEKNEFLPKKNKKSKKKSKKKGVFILEISNIDKNINEKETIEFFKIFNCKDAKIFTDQNGNKKGHITFDNEEYKNNFIDNCLGMSTGNKNNNWKIKTIEC